MFVGDGRVSYIERSRKEMRKGSSLQISGNVIFYFGRSHFVQAPWDPSLIALDLRLSSSRCWTTAWIMSLLCLGSAFLHCWKWEDPSPCHLTHGFPMMSFSFSALLACVTDVSAAHLRPDLVVTPALLTFSSVESWYILVMYSPTDVNLVGILSHLLRCVFTRFSTLHCCYRNFTDCQ